MLQRKFSLLGHNHTAADIADLTEAVQDVVGALVINSTSITWTYNDGAGTLSGAVSLAPFTTSNLTEGSNLYFTDERAQDAVGTILTDSSTIDFTYNDGAGTISAVVINDSITYAKMQNVSAASKLLGRGSAGGAGDPEEITLGSGLSMSGTTLSASLSASSLSTVILADTPTGFWKCDDTSGTTLVDSSGNGFDMTLTGTFSLASRYLIPTLPTTKFIKFGTSATSFAKRTGTLGITMPLTGDYTIEACVLSSITSIFQSLFNIMGVGETNATNFQCDLALSTANVVQAFWEHGAGTNDLISSTVSIDYVSAWHLAIVKDGTANTIDFYINGKLLTTVSYANEPSDGSTVDTYIGGNPTDTGSNATLGYVAFYNGSKLSADRIAAHASAAGLFR